MQIEIPVQEGNTGTNREKYHRESDDTKAGGAEMFILFLCGSRTPDVYTDWGKGGKKLLVRVEKVRYIIYNYFISLTKV